MPIDYTTQIVYTDSMYKQMICQRCDKPTQRTSSAQKYCPDCSLIHKKEYGLQYWHSDKGRAIYKHRLDLMRKQPKRQPHLCITCGKQISRRSTYCKPCFLDKARHSPSDQAPNWKGGRRIAHGYVFVRCSRESGSKGYISEHRSVWEKAHGEKLPNDWIIHHLNGIRNDNRPANLVAMPRKKHNRLQQAMAKRIQELEALLNQQGLLL